MPQLLRLIWLWCALSAAQSDCDADEGLSLRQLRGLKSSWSFTKPDPEVLVWDKIVAAQLRSTTGPYNVTIYNGWLKVPLVHDPVLMEYEMPPEVCLRVRGIAALKQPAKNGPLLTHCGGPGSGRDCAQLMADINFDIDGQHTVISDFDLLAIDQRGVNISADANETADGWGEVKPCPFKQSGKKLEPFPMVYCDEIKRNFNDSKEEVMSHLAFGETSTDAWETYVKPILDDGSIPYKHLAVFNESFARWFYRVLELEHGLCFRAGRYQLHAPNGRAYNALQFAGTVDLAHDLDLLRQAIGAWKMSLYGASYGTSVASVYASIFPSTTLRVVLDGVVNPTPDVAVRGEAFASGIESVWDGIIRDCESTMSRGKDERCVAAPGSAAKAMAVLKGSNTSQAADLMAMIELTVMKYQTMLSPLLMACIEQFHSGKEVEGCNTYIELAEKLTGSSDSNATNATNVSASNASASNATSSASNASASNASASNASANTSEVPKDRFELGIQALVMGTDTAGRLSEDEFITWWTRTKERAPIGVDWASSWMVAMSTWPSYARPVPPVGNSDLKAVVIGNLHDPNTAYESAQKMKTAFPAGYLVTWQGYGHCLKAETHGAELQKDYKEAMAEHSLPQYTNAVAKYACMSKILSYLDTGLGIQDGHTCLVPEPLNLTRAAVSALLAALEDSSTENATSENATKSDTAISK